jgi:hypothetical protein
MSRHTLYLEGWQHQSNWGWDPGQNVWYAQLWVDGTEPGGGDEHDAPALWLTPPSYVITQRQRLAGHIADFLDVDVRIVLVAFLDSYESQWQIYGGENDWEPEPPLTTERIHSAIRTVRFQIDWPT